MKNLKLAAAAGLFALVLAGCGQGAATETTAETAAETTEAAGEETAEEASAEESEETSAEADEAGGQETSGEAEEETEDGAEESAAGGYEDNFSVDSQAAADFAVQVLADLTAYPVYVGIGEGQAVESEEDFLALDPAEVFTDELKSAVASADPEALEPSEAGFVLSDENGKSNIIFGVVDGELAVRGINY